MPQMPCLARLSRYLIAAVCVDACDLCAVLCGIAGTRSYELFIYPGADHGYAQPFFNGGRNYNAEAVRATWVLVDDFLGSHVKP